MTPVPVLAGERLAGRPGLPLLVVGPSIGTSVRALWSEAATLLDDAFDVIGWDLPGHGLSPVAGDGFDVDELAEGVIALVGGLTSSLPGGSESFSYAGDSIGGAVGLRLLLDYPDRVQAAIVLCTGAKIGEAAQWHERAELVRAEGIQGVVELSAQRWFGPGFADGDSVVADTLLDALRAVDAESYAFACEALARFDVRDRLSSISGPLLAIAGAEDVATPVDRLREIAAGVADGRVVVLDRVAHLAPAEAPRDVAGLIRGHAARSGRDRGMVVRRAVLGDQHVDAAGTETTGFTEDFQNFITEFAWAGIWTRPGLDRRSRSMITLTALVAGGHLEELALHVRAARTNGLSDEEIMEVLLQTAIYCGVPAANAAFRVAKKVLEELDE